MSTSLSRYIFALLAICLFTALSGCDRADMFTIANSNITVLHVSATGDDALGDGSMDAPYLTLNRAVSEASGKRAAIHVALGTYSLTEHIVLPAGVCLYGGYDPVTWERLPFTTAVDRATNQTLLTYSGSYDGAGYPDPSRVIECSDPDMGNSTVIEGFTIEGENGDNTPCGILVTGGAAPTIRFNSIYGGNTTGSSSYAISICYTSGVKVENNLLNQGSGSPSALCGTITCYDAGCTISGNTVTSLPGRCCMFLYGGSNVTVTGNSITSIYTGIRVDSSTAKATITGNTIVADPSSTIAVYLTAESLTMKDNIIDHSGSTTGGCDAVRVNNCVNAVLSENTIIAGSSLSSYSNAITVYGSGSTKILRNTIRVGSAAGYEKSGISINSTGSVIIASNYIDGSGSFVTYGIKCTESSPEIVNNTIIGGNGGAESYGIYLNTAASPVIINNIITATAATAFGILDFDDPSIPSQLRNNLFTACNARYKHFDTEQVTIADVNNYSTYFSGNLDDTVCTVSIDASSGNITTGAGDIADLGLDISTLCPDAMTDILGKTRNTPVSIGAYEY